MSNIICYNPIKGIDDVIASKMGNGFSPHRVATLRGMYDASSAQPLDTSNPDMAAIKLANYNRSQIRERAKEIQETSTHFAESYRKVRQEFTAEERFDRVNMIAYIFSQRLTAMQNNTPGVTRTQIANGYKDTQDLVRGGEFNIFEGVHSDILTAYEQATANGNTERAEKLQKVLDNWAALVTFARIRLRDTEGLVLGSKSSYSAEVDPSNYMDEDMSSLFNVEEAKREGWQEVAAAISSFGSLGKDVRRFLSNIQVTEDGKPATDDLGIPKMLDPVKAHQALLEILRGCTSKETMMYRLRQRAESAEWLKPIVASLETPPYSMWENMSESQRNYWNSMDQLKTKLFVDLKKNFQPYSAIRRVVENGIVKFKTFILNKTNKDIALQKYTSRAVFGKPLSENAIYDNNGKVNWEKVKEFRDLVSSYLSDPDQNILTSKFWEASKAQRLDFIVRTATLLDIPMTPASAEQLLYNRKDLRAYIKALTDLKFRILDTIMKGKTDLGDTRYSNFIKREIGASKVKLSDRLNTLASLGVKYTESSKLERSCRYNGSKKRGTTYYSDVNPSYLGDEVDRIQEFVEAGDSEGLRAYIRSKYLGTSYFKDGDKILNWWIKELYEGGIDDSSFAANFIAPDRLLGEEGNEFENFTSKAHAEALLAKYFAIRQQNMTSEEAWTRDYGEYPIFILGDSGVAKFIKAKRYDSYTSTDTLLEGFYDVYRQEKRRQALVEATVRKMNPWAVREDNTIDWKKVTVKIDNFSDSYNRFTFLPFLNKDYKDSKGKVTSKYANMLSDNPTESEVKEAIKAYMKDAQQAFVDRMVELGVFNKAVTQDGRAVYSSPALAQEVTSERTFEQVVQDYFWNTKFATIQQLQMFTIDPAYYKGTKDLQKRYKEIHAPGSVLDPTARWHGELVAGENPIERCLYFDDISVNAESVDTEFMNAILYNFATAPEAEVEKAISEGITIPKEGKEETSRVAKLKSLLGKNWDIYKSYQKNTLTDGQGYRTLQSYRKVMIMAGKWDDTMEKCYNELQSIRRQYGKDQDVPKEVLQKITALSVTFMPIKPYMYTFGNYALNDTDKLLIPVQHKYAEAVLIPELLPKGSKLRDMAYWMEEHTENGKEAPIDLICSTKAVKVGGFGSTDISKVKSNEELSSALSKGYIHQLSYSDYRIQTNVPEHINGAQLFGTQVRKLIMANVLMQKDYGKYTGGKVPRLFRNKDTKVKVLNGRNLIQFYNALIGANILDSFDVFSEGVKDTSSLSDALLQSTIANSRESIDNILSYALGVDGDFTIPLFEGGLEHDSAALVFSLFKKLVNKQKINGGSAVQVSAMGITGYAEDGGLQYVVDPNNPKNILYAETEIPFDLSYIDDSGQTVELQYDDWVNSDGTLKTNSEGTLLLEIEFPGITNIIAYRIPTERDYSMINLKVVRFSRKEAGGTIKVPPQGTTIAGFDFDIDKLYFMRRQYKRKAHYMQEGFSSSELFSIFAEIYENHPEIKAALEEIRDASGDYTYITGHKSNGETYQKKQYNHPLNHYWNQMLEQNPSFVADPAYDKDALFTEAVTSLIERGELEEREERKETYLDTYDYDKTPLRNSRIARNNMLIDLISQRLQDPETFKQRYTPGGFKNASSAARMMRELLFGDLSDIVSADGIDIKALASRVQNPDTDPEPNYDPSDPLTIITYNQQNQVAGKLIGIFANQNTNHAFASLMSRMTIKPGFDFEFCGHRYSDFLHGPSGVDVDLNVAEFLAASVDAVKDPVLNFLNLNTLTADAGATLARLGYTTEEIGLLFNQPIIREICDFAFNNNVSLDTATRNVLESYKRTAGTGRIPAVPSNDFTKERLIKSIISGRERSENNKALDKGEAIQQIKIAELFAKITTVSRDLSEFVTNTKFTASNAAGSTFGDYYSQQLKVKDYLDRMRNTDEKAFSVSMEVSPELRYPISDSRDFATMSKEEYLESLMSNPFAYEQAMFDMNRRALEILAEYFPYETSLYKNMRGRLNNLVSFGHLDAATINTLHSDFMVYMLGQQENSVFNGEGVSPEYIESDGKPTRTTNRKFYKEVFPELLFAFKESHPELANSAIFRYMDISYNEETKTVSLNIQNIGGLKPYQKDELRDSWSELMKTHPEMATGLFMYNFYTLGFTFSPRAFMNIAPTEVKEKIMVGDISYVDFLKKVKRGEVNVDIERFAEMFMLNHTDNNRLVYTVSGNDKKTVSALAIEGKSFKQEFTLDISNFEDESTGFLIADPTLGEGLVAFKPILAIPYVSDDGSMAVAYYKASTEDSAGTGKFNVSSSSTMRYVYTEKLGDSNVSLQYLGTPVATPMSREPAPQAPTEGRTDLIPEVTNEIKGMSDEAIATEIATEMAAAYAKLGMKDDQGQPYGVEALKLALLKNEGREQLELAIATIRKACRENGIVVLNENGEPMLGC